MMTYFDFITVEPMVRIGLTFLLYESSVLPLNYIGGCAWRTGFIPLFRLFIKPDTSRQSGGGTKDKERGNDPW